MRLHHPRDGALCEHHEATGVIQGMGLHVSTTCPQDAPGKTGLHVSPARPQEALGNGPPDDCPPGGGHSDGRLCLPQQLIYRCSVILDLFI